MSGRFNVAFPSDLKQRLEEMSSETGISMTQLCVLGMWSLVSNYESKGSFIFADLLNPSHRDSIKVTKTKVTPQAPQKKVVTRNPSLQKQDNPQKEQTQLRINDPVYQRAKKMLDGLRIPVVPGAEENK